MTTSRKKVTALQAFLETGRKTMRKSETTMYPAEMLEDIREYMRAKAAGKTNRSIPELWGYLVRNYGYSLQETTLSHYMRTKERTLWLAIQESKGRNSK